MFPSSSRKEQSARGGWSVTKVFALLASALLLLVFFRSGAKSAGSRIADSNMSSTTPNTASGVTLSADQSKIVSSVLGLFAGEPSADKLSLWADDAAFVDPLTTATGRKQYEPQWYGLKTICSKIVIQSHKVTSSGNPIEVDMDILYTLKAIGKDQPISSKVKIHTQPDGKISKVEDRWNNELPDSTVTNALRRLNAASVPKFVGVPDGGSGA